jgi:sterol desaturase/sphingolipid hydroxylase (fatty acid hydroxylase superfamily)
MGTILQSLSLPEILLLQWGVNLTRYTLFAGGAWLVFWKWFYPKYRARRIADRDPEPGQIRREILLSAVSMTIFLLPVAILILSARTGISKAYFHAGDRGWAWYVASYFALFAWHDTYFYWTHRAMHWKPLYRLVHHTHHLSRHPTPFTAFAFHPLEAVIESLALVSFAFVFPVHVGVLAIFTLFSLAFNVYGHLGIRVLSHEGKISRYFNGPETHGAHHERFTGNFSLYTNVWDRAMGTLLKPKSRPAARTEVSA